jgi:hypothetical protein
MKTGKHNQTAEAALLFLLVAVSYFLFGLHYIDDWDFPLHLRMGETILKNGVPRFDDFSFRGAGWQVYIDGRNQLYSDEMIERAFTALKDFQIFKDEEARYGFDAVLLDTTDSMAKALLNGLKDSPDWALVYRDRIYAVYLKDNDKNHQSIGLFRLKTDD